ncbi:MAG: hypothetical protein HGA25_05260 [Clostridiales bacterium]|nr:hypothetical protein [Clostridiales bacterium]
MASFVRRMIDIITYWLDLGVDGFRCDVANMVPLAFRKNAPGCRSRA